MKCIFNSIAYCNLFLFNFHLKNSNFNLKTWVYLPWNPPTMPPTYYDYKILHTPWTKRGELEDIIILTILFSGQPLFIKDFLF